MMKKSEFDDLEKQTYEVDVKTEDIQSSKRRAEFEILYTIFKAVEIEGKIYHILERAGVSFNQWKKYNLVKRGFIEEKSLSEIYVLKEKARKFIEEFDGIIKLGVVPEENIKLREIPKKPPSPKPIVLDDSLKSMRKWQGDVTRVKYSNNYEIKIRMDAGDTQLNENALKKTILKILGVRYKGLSLDQFAYDKPTGIAIFYVNSGKMIRYQDVLNAINEIRKNRNMLLMA